MSGDDGSAWGQAVLQFVALGVVPAWLVTLGWYFVLAFFRRSSEDDGEGERG